MVFSQNEIILMIVVVSVLLVFITILTILDIKEYKKGKKEELTGVEENESDILPKKLPEDETVYVEEETPSLQNEVVNEKENKEEEIFIEEVEAPINNEEIFIEEEKNIEDSHINTENNFLNEELNNTLNTIVDDVKTPLYNYEEEQERTAIISLNELMSKTDELYNENEFVQYDDGNEPISIDEVINMYKEPEIKEEPQLVKEVIEDKKDLYTKKESIPFISSIYGMEKNEMSFENTANFEKFDRQKNNEFMQKLKEMNENK